MDNKFMQKITDEVWGKWRSVPIFLAFSILTGMPIIINILSVVSYTVTRENISYILPRKEGIYSSAIIAICFLGLNIWNLLFVYSKNHIKRASRGKTGIIIYIDANDRQVYDETLRKFGEEFKSKLFEGFEVIYVPYGMKKINYRNNKIVPFLQRRNCLLYLNIGINYDKDYSVVTYDMQINGSIIHATYSEDVEKEFQKTFSSILHNFKDIVFPSKEMIKKMRITATEMSLACEYVIGLSLFLNGDFVKAEMVLRGIVNKPTNEKWRKVIESVQKIRCEMFNFYVKINLEKYQRQCNDVIYLDEADEMLEKAKECCGMTYEYCLNKAYYYVARKQDSKSASELINLCKQMKGIPLIWKYSEAFLKAYDNKSISAIVTSYNAALRVTYNISDLIIFTESALEREPHRSGLFLALGIMYRYIGDEELANENIEKYIDCSKDRKKSIDILSRKKLYIENSLALI